MTNYEIATIVLSVLVFLGIVYQYLYRVGLENILISHWRRMDEISDKHKKAGEYFSSQIEENKEEIKTLSRELDLLRHSISE